MADLWQSKAEDAVARSWRSAREKHRLAMQEIYDTACAYATADMADDVDAELTYRYPGSNKGNDAGQEIIPVAMSFVKQYLDEMATAYANPVLRKLNKDGETDSEATEKYNRYLDDIGFDSTMHAIERKVILLRSCGRWDQITTGEYDPVEINPQNLLVLEGDEPPVNRANPKSYAGYSIDQRIVDKEVNTYSDGRKVKLWSYTAVFPEGVVAYRGTHPGEAREFDAPVDNPFFWPQPVIDKSGKPVFQNGTLLREERPLQMVTVWHSEKPSGDLIPMFEPAILTSNRALNVLWSVVLDIMRFQGGSMITIGKGLNKDVAEKLAVGVRNPYVYDPQRSESVNFENAANDWSGLTALLQSFAKTVGITEGMAPGDFSIDETKVTSGIAKIIESLPKDRKRDKRAKWFAQQERTQSFPRTASIMRWLGIFGDEITEYDLSVEFRGERRPLSIEERVKEEGHDLSLGLTTPAKILADRTGVTVENAEATIRENLGLDEEQKPFTVDDADKLIYVVASVARSEIPKETAIKTLMVVFGMPQENAEDLLADLPDKYEEEKIKAEEKAARAEEREERRLEAEQKQPDQAADRAPEQSRREAFFARLAGTTGGGDE